MDGVVIEKLFYSDTDNWCIEEVAGNPNTARDCKGRYCFTNTHFKTYQEALDNLIKCAEARIELEGDALARLKLQVLSGEQRCGDAAIAFSKVQELKRKQKGGE